MKHFKMRTTKLTALFMAVLTAGSILTLSSCSKTNSSTAESAPTPSTGSTSTTADSAASTASSSSVALTQKLSAYSQKPEFAAPGDKIDAKKLMKGKKWITIPASSGNPFNQITCDIMKKVGAEAGFEISPWANQGDVTEWQQGIESAPSKGASLVDLFAGPTPDQLSSQIKNVQKQGIKVVTSSLVDYSQKVNYVDANMGNDYYKGGELLADWAISKKGDNTNAIVIVAEEITSTLAMEDAIKTEFATNCPKGKYKFVNVPLVDWSTKIQPQVENALLADPSINYVIAIYDSMTQYIVPAVESTGRTSSTKVIGFNGTPFVLDNIKSGKVEMTIGQSLDWIARAVVDYEMRVDSGLPLPKKENIGLRIWTANNVNEAMGSKGKAEYSTGYGTSYQDGYAKLWGLK